MSTLPLHVIHQPAGRFLGPIGIRHRPLRALPVVADERELLDRIRAGTTILDEPECLGPAILDDYAQVAQLHRSQQHARDVAAARQRRPLLDTDDRLRDLMRRAQHAKVDLTREHYLMRRDLQRAQAGGRRAPLRVLERLDRLESLLDGLPARAA